VVPRFHHLSLTPADGVLEVVIDRADSRLNAVNGELHDDLTELFSYLAGHDESRAVLLMGTEDAFSAGGDFGWFPELADRERLERLRRDAKRLIYALLDVPQPVVAAVRGPAVGLGASIALLCDTIVMGRSATLADPHVRVGLVAGDGGTIAWPLAVGPARAKQYLLTGDPVTAEEAERIGLVNRVVDDHLVVDEAKAFARRLASGAPLAIRYTKIAVNAAVKAQAAIAFDQALAHEIATFASADHREALQAWQERRPPRFIGS
jgi:enoyl-CoA hydratase